MTNQALATFTIKHFTGQTETGIDTYEDAVAKVREAYGDDVEIGHSGDINDFGDRTLCWQTDVPEADRDGSRACCSIVKVYWSEWIRHGSFGPIVWRADGSTRAATQRDMDRLPVGDDLSAADEVGIEE